MKMSRIEVCAMLKSMIEANVPAANWRSTIENASELFQEYGGPVGAAASSAPVPAGASPAVKPWSGPVTVTSIERKVAANGNNFASLEIQGCEIGRFCKAWDNAYNAVCNVEPGTVMEVVVTPKPNPKNPSQPYLNLTSAKLAQQASRLVANDDIPF